MSERDERAKRLGYMVVAAAWLAVFCLFGYRATAASKEAGSAHVGAFSYVFLTLSPPIFNPFFMDSLLEWSCRG
jgi:hypothetical protein